MNGHLRVDVCLEPAKIRWMPIVQILALLTTERDKVNRALDAL
jgi:hypothetical protein